MSLLVLFKFQIQGVFNSGLTSCVFEFLMNVMFDVIGNFYCWLQGSAAYPLCS